jgi:hypothetical protein
VVAGIQAKLKVGQPGDIYEQEADRVADAVMRMPEPGVQRQVEPEEEEEEELLQTKPLAEEITPRVQRQVEPEEEEEEQIQTKALSEQITHLVQRQEGEEEEIQTKPLPSQTSEVVSDVEASINSIRGGGQPLHESTRSFFEPRFGQDFSQVRLHTDARAAESARAVNARAFTVGCDVVFGAGQYAPGTSEGRRLMAHELTHVVQQMGDRIQRKLAIDPPNDRFEQEVDGNGRTITPVAVSITDNLPNVSTEVGIQIQKYSNTGWDGGQYVGLDIPDGDYVLDTANIPASVECLLSWANYLTVYGTASQFDPRHIDGLDADPHELHDIRGRATNETLRSTFRIKPGRDMERTPGLGSAKVQAFRHGWLSDEEVLQAHLTFTTVPLFHSVGQTTSVATHALDMTRGRPNYVNLARGTEIGGEETITHTVIVTRCGNISADRLINFSTNGRARGHRCRPC